MNQVVAKVVPNTQPTRPQGGPHMCRTPVLGQTLLAASRRRPEDLGLPNPWSSALVLADPHGLLHIRQGDHHRHRIDRRLGKEVVNRDAMEFLEPLGVSQVDGARSARIRPWPSSCVTVRHGFIDTHQPA